MAVLKKNIVGPRIREARQRHKPRLTQDQLSARLAALRVSIDRAGIAKIEGQTRGVCDFELKAIGKVLRVSMQFLLGGA